MSKIIRQPLSNKSNEQAQVVRRRPKKDISKQTRIRSSCIFSSDPPPGCQFLTTFECKYYGSGTLRFDVTQPFVQQQCMQIVHQVLAKNKKASRPTVLGITDKGLSVHGKTDGEQLLDLITEQLFKIVPGTLRTKNGKTVTIVIVVQFDPKVPRADQFSAGIAFDQLCHVFQCAHRADAAYMHEAAKRMWRDHMFHNLLDVSTEQAQEEFTSFMIQQDIEAAYAKCEKVISNDLHDAKRRASSLIESDLFDSQIAMGIDSNWIQEGSMSPHQQGDNYPLDNTDRLLQQQQRHQLQQHLQGTPQWV